MVNSGLCLRETPSLRKIAADLEHAVVAADEQALQAQLKRDAQEKVRAQRVVVRGEGPRRRAARHALEHGRLDLEELPVLASVRRMLATRSRCAASAARATLR
jgi:hypothetical protein